MRMASPFERFAKQRTVLLTSYRRDGAGIGTPVNIAVEGDRAFVRTFDSAWKLKRIRNNPLVEIAPSTNTGKATGTSLRSRARILTGDEAARASRAIDKKYPVLHGIVVPLIHRMRGNTTVHFELTPA